MSRASTRRNENPGVMNSTVLPASSPVRATVSDFGPQLLAKVLGSNDTQEQSLSLVFHFADEKGLPLLDLSDLRALLTYLDSDAGKPDLKGIGGLAGSTVGVLLRALVSDWPPPAPASDR